MTQKGYVISYENGYVKQTAMIWLNKDQAQKDLERYAFDEKDRNLGNNFQNAKIKEIEIPILSEDKVYVKDDDNILEVRDKKMALSSDWESKRIYNIN